MKALSSAIHEYNQSILKSSKPSDPGPGGLARPVFRCFRHSGFRVNRRLVCQPAQAVVESAGVGLRPGVDLALRADGDRGVAGVAQGRALGLFLLQWLLNALWTPLFFGMHRSGLAFVEITTLWLVLAATLVWFWRVRKAAGVLLSPYLAWVSFAAALNFTILRLNP
jgi:hypothetical protein